jgi:hypothetical protein
MTVQELIDELTPYKDNINEISIELRYGNVPPKLEVNIGLFGVIELVIKSDSIKEW